MGHCPEHIRSRCSGLYICRIGGHASKVYCSTRKWMQSTKVTSWSNRHPPSHPTFASADRRLREIDSFAISNTCTLHSRSVTPPETENYVLDRFQETPSTSTRAVTAEISVSSTTVWPWFSHGQAGHLPRAPTIFRAPKSCCTFFIWIFVNFTILM